MLETLSYLSHMQLPNLLLDAPWMLYLEFFFRGFHRNWWLYPWVFHHTLVYRRSFLLYGLCFILHSLFYNLSYAPCHTSCRALNSYYREVRKACHHEYHFSYGDRLHFSWQYRLHDLFLRAQPWPYESKMALLLQLYGQSWSFTIEEALYFTLHTFPKTSSCLQLSPYSLDRFWV